MAVLNESAVWVFVTVSLLLFYFPDGTAPGRRWRWIPPTLLVAVVIGHVTEMFNTGEFRPPLTGLAHPFRPPPLWLEVLSVPAFGLLLGLTLACAVSLVVRFRRSDRVRRAQIKWLALAGVGVPLYPLICLVEIGLWGRPLWLSLAIGVAALVGIPVATAIAIVRHDLYDVDKALAAAVTYTLVTAVLLGIYAVTSFAGGLVLGRGSAVAAAGATAVCALALSPLRRRLQRGVDRRLYPLRRAALAAVEALHRDTSAGQARPEALEEVLRSALRDPAPAGRLPGARHRRVHRRRPGGRLADRCLAGGAGRGPDRCARARCRRHRLTRAAAAGRRRGGNAGRGGAAAAGAGRGAARGGVQPGAAAADRV